jgi:hypothetical protein
MWTRLQQLLARIITSTEIEATHDSIAYHASERAGELHFSQSSSLWRFY